MIDLNEDELNDMAYEIGNEFWEVLAKRLSLLSNNNLRMKCVKLSILILITNYVGLIKDMTDKKAICHANSNDPVSFLEFLKEDEEFLKYLVSKVNNIQNIQKEE